MDLSFYYCYGSFYRRDYCCAKITSHGITLAEQRFLAATNDRNIHGYVGLITAYCLWWEAAGCALAWNWNEWCRNMRLMWHKRAHQHLVILYHVFLYADPDFLSRLANLGGGQC